MDIAVAEVITHRGPRVQSSPQVKFHSNGLLPYNPQLFHRVPCSSHMYKPWYLSEGSVNDCICSASSGYYLRVATVQAVTNNQ